MSPEQFDEEFGPEFAQQNTTDPAPYGYAAHPVKPGLTKRGKAAIAIGVTVLAGGGILAFQHYSTQQAEANTKAQELALKQQELRIQELRELNKANEANSKAQETHNKELQKQVKACVDADKGLIGKQLGVTYSSVLEDCQAQYGTTDNAGADMQEAASATDTSSGGGGVALNEGVLVAVGALGIGAVVLVRKGARSNAA
ncbi:hypothetical protein OIA45_48560 (plasmid) [Streptomyces chartreusis]|uniref:hypothetical protein n=1 Tax=Streptomyces chartreusis TaxID=1969 RepID=UPI0037DC4DCE|nr:hypothetical protein OIA45_48560 [Streptomyces chartreusis]